MLRSVYNVNTKFRLDKNCWDLFFDGFKYKHGSRCGYVLIDLEGNKTFKYFWLEFECTNNVSKYEALIQGLRKAIDLKFKVVNVLGES